MITLEPPYTRGAVLGRDTIALSQSLTYGRTGGMSRWHIPRTGTLRDQTRRIYSAWCGGATLRPDDGEALMTDAPDDGLPICGTCVGRAMGAGVHLSVVSVEHEGGLLFQPVRIRIPRFCPGGRYASWHEQNHRVGRCYVCRDYWPISHGRGGYDTRPPTLSQHSPGPNLVDPCPFHAWDQIDAAGACTCGHPSIQLQPREGNL